MDVAEDMGNLKFIQTQVDYSLHTELQQELYFDAYCSMLYCT